MQLSGIRLCTNTGAHLPQAQIELLRERLPNSQVAPMYGLTECKRVAILRPEEVASKPGSVGRPLDDTSAYIVDDAGNLLPPGRWGVGDCGPPCGFRLLAGAGGDRPALQSAPLRYRPRPSTVAITSARTPRVICITSAAAMSRSSARAFASTA